MRKSIRTARTIEEFLGSAHIFTSAVNDIVEKRLLEDAAGGELTMSQFKLLRMVGLTDACTITDAAVLLGVSKAAASKAVDRLVRRKLLHRAAQLPDRREVRLLLTPASRQLLGAYHARKQRMLAQLFHAFPAGRLRRAGLLLDQLSAGLLDHAGDPDETCLQCGIHFRERCLVREMLKRHCFYSRRLARRFTRRRQSTPAAARG